MVGRVTAGAPLWICNLHYFSNGSLVVEKLTTFWTGDRTFFALPFSSWLLSFQKGDAGNLSTVLRTALVMVPHTFENLVAETAAAIMGWVHSPDLSK